METFHENNPNTPSGQWNEIESLAHAEALAEISYDTDKSRLAIAELFTSMQAYAERNGMDSVYGEVHKIGESYIPLPALVDTYGWGVEDEGLGYVTESSGHTLAEIYYDKVRFPEDTNHETEKRQKTSRALQDLGVLDFISATGLGSDRKTLRQRGRFTFDAEGSITFDTKEDYNLRHTTDQAAFNGVVEGLARFGIKTRVREGTIEMRSLGLLEVPEISKVVVHIQDVNGLIPLDERNAYGSELKVLQAASIQEDPVSRVDVLGVAIEGTKKIELRFVEGQARRHDDLRRYASGGVFEASSDNSLSIELGGASLMIDAQYDEIDGVASLVFMVECSSEQLKERAGDLEKIVEDTAQAIRHRDRYAGGVPIKTTLLHRESSGGAWSRVEE